MTITITDEGAVHVYGVINYGDLDLTNWPPPHDHHEWADDEYIRQIAKTVHYEIPHGAKE